MQNTTKDWFRSNERKAETVSELQRRKRFSYIFFAVKGAYTLLVFINMLLIYLGEPNPVGLLVLSLSGLGLLLALFCTWLVSRGQVTLANALIFATDIMIVVWWASVSGGIAGAVPLFLYGVYGAQAFLLPRRLYVVIASLGLVSLLVMGVLQASAVLKPLPRDGISTYVINYLGALLVLLAISSYFSGTLSAAVNRLLNQKGALDRANSSLLEQQRTREVVSGQVANAASQVAQEASDQAERAQQTTQAVTQASGAVVRLSREAVQVANAAGAVSDAASQTLGQVASVKQKVGSGIAGLEQSVQQVNLIADLARQLEEQSRMIGTVIESVEEVASETHLLALNATIEAAGAGPYGARFTVVAREVSELAASSNQATVQVRTMLADLAAAIGQVAEASRQGLTMTIQGAEQVRQVAAAADQIEGLSRHTAGLAESISQTTAQQRQASEQAAIQMRKILNLVEREAAGASEGARAAANLREAAHQLEVTDRISGLPTKPLDNNGLVGIPTGNPAALPRYVDGVGRVGSPATSLPSSPLTSSDGGNDSYAIH